MATNTAQDDLDLGATIRGFAAGQVVFGRYRLDRVLGRGGMGVVWLARDQEMGEDIALKFLPEAVRIDALGLDELKAETRKSRKLTHRNIVRVHDFVSDDHSAGISMEWVDGSTLSTLRLGRPNMVFEPEELKLWVKQVCEALEYAHNVAKLIHRDLKAANIMVNGAGEVKVADFGISSSLTESASRVSAQRSTSGTLAYMSPQQALGERPMVADDIYSLGATLYELIAGKPPFFRGDLYAQVRDVVPPPMAERRAESEISADGIPEPWEATVAACLENDPAKRPQSAMEVAWRLGLVKEYEPRVAPEISKPKILRVPKEELKGVFPKPGTGRDPRLAAAGALGLVLLAVAGWYFLRPHPAPPIAQNSTPAPSAMPTATPAPTVPPAPSVAPTVPPTPAPVPTASAIAQMGSPGPSPGTPLMAPSAAPSASGTQAAVDKQLIGSWQSGSSSSTRKRLKLQADGKYLYTVGGTVKDSGTLSAADGHIEQFSKNSPQPIDLTYEFDDTDLVTEGDGPLGGVEWSKVAAVSGNSSVHHTVHEDSDDEDNGGGVKQHMLDNFRSRYGF